MIAWKIKPFPIPSFNRFAVNMPNQNLYIFRILQVLSLSPLNK